MSELHDLIKKDQEEANKKVAINPVIEIPITDQVITKEVTQEDLDANAPDLSNAGIQVGDKIEIAVTNTDEAANEQ